MSFSFSAPALSESTLLSAVPMMPRKDRNAASSSAVKLPAGAACGSILSGLATCEAVAQTVRAASANADDIHEVENRYKGAPQLVPPRRRDLPPVA